MQVTSVDVSADGNVLVVAISGQVNGTRIGRSAVQIYSLITRQKVWTKFLYNEVESAWLDNASGRKLCFVYDGQPDVLQFVRLDEDFTYHSSTFAPTTSLVSVSDDASSYVSVVDDTIIRLGMLSRSTGSPRRSRRRELCIRHNPDDATQGSPKFLVQQVLT